MKTLEAFVSVEIRNAHGHILKSNGFRIEHRVPVLYLHGESPIGFEPIGVVEDAWVGHLQYGEIRHPAVIARIGFFSDPLGEFFFKMVSKGIIDEWSVHHHDVESHTCEDSTRIVEKWILREVSLVPSGACPLTFTVLPEEFDEKGISGI